MNTDRELLCSERQAIVGPVVSTDSLRLAAFNDLDKARPLRCFAATEGSFTGTATGLTIELVQADNAALTVNVESLGTTGTIPTAQLNPARVVLDAALPAVQRPYFGYRYTPVGGSFGTGSITAGLVTATGTPISARPNAAPRGWGGAA